MNQKVNEAYKPLFLEPFRYALLVGGRGGGRSTVASQYAIAKLMGKEYFRCAIMRYILGDIRNSIYREIVDRAEENGILDQLDVNQSLMGIVRGQNSINAVGFRKSSGDQRAKLKSLASYNCIIIEEADEIPEEDFMQLTDSLRTTKGNITIILLFNPPPKSHWIIQRWLKLIVTPQKGFYDYELKDDIKDTLLIKTSYKDNIANMDPQSIEQYEAYRETKPDHYWNMVVGYVPETVQGKIYSGWKVIDELPHEARLERYGGDYGYTNDPTGIVAIYYYNGGYILDEIAYQHGLSNKQIADILLNVTPALAIFDSAEPKSNDELKSYGVNLLPSQKGQGSVSQGIQYVQAQKISVTKRSLNLLKEYENYAWKIDKQTGEITNVPANGYDHLMDALRYAFETLKPIQETYDNINEGLKARWTI